MKRTALLAVLALLAILALTPADEASALPSTCHPNPRLAYSFIEEEAVCAGGGDGCTFCNEVGARGDGSWDVCYFSIRTGDITCYSMN